MTRAMLFKGGKILIKSDFESRGKALFADSMLVKDGMIVSLGSQSELDGKELGNTAIRDLQGRYVLPGFVDGHMYLLLLGQSLTKLRLRHCKNLEDIRSAIQKHADTNPNAPSILCGGWMHFMTLQGVTTAMLNDLDPRPVFVDASSLHSCWCNSTALEDFGVSHMSDPAGGKIRRDALGRPSGLLDERAMMSIVCPYQAASSPRKERIEAISAVVQAYSAAGYTGIVEMIMDEEAWDALVAL